MAALVGQSRVLQVPYFAQPTGITCQSTCLKMMARYLEQAVVFQSTGAGAREILDIWKDINESKERPVKARNAHANMKWWLERHFPSLHFDYHTIMDEIRACETVIEFINFGMPVLMSVSHARVEGHIILVVGYENYVPMMSTADFHLVVHDPYGKFDPSLLSSTYGAKRYVGGMSLMSGGQVGPGQNCPLHMTGVGRQRVGDARRGTYYLLSARR
jgi:Peptidase_C39 like family